MSNRGGVAGRVGRGSLIGIVVAVVLLASPLVAVGSASGSAGTGAVSSPRAATVRHLAFLAPVASFLMQELASNATSLGFGWVLGQFGLGDGVDPQIGAIQTKLQEIEDRLTGLAAATSQLRAELAQGTFSGLVAQATPVIAQINQGMSDLDFIASMGKHDPTKRALTERTLKFIDDHLLFGKQQELAARMTGEAGGDGLIVAAYKTVKANAGDFWTRLDSTRVRNVVEYYQSAEARLLLLRVEYMHAHPTTYSDEYVQGQITRVERMLAEQNSMLKPEPGPYVIADTRTRLDWLWSALFWPTEWRDVADRSRAAHSGHIGVEGVGKGWLRCSAAEVAAFVSGWSGDKGWVGWLSSKIGGQIPQPSRFPGVWTNHSYTSDLIFTGEYARVFGGQGAQKDVLVSGRGRSGQVPKLEQFGLLFVRTRDAPYWY
jgi:hypothetical protein